MRRREFITLIGGATVLPLVARAQQAVKVARIGFLGAVSEAGYAKQLAAIKARTHLTVWYDVVSSPRTGNKDAASCDRAGAASSPMSNDPPHCAGTRRRPSHDDEFCSFLRRRCHGSGVHCVAGAGTDDAGMQRQVQGGPGSRHRQGSEVE